MDNSQNNTTNGGGSGTPNINLKYKTSRCRHFDQTGNCQLAERCHFAHGDRDLRSINDPIPKEQVDYAQRPVQYTKPGAQPSMQPQMMNGGHLGGMAPQPVPGQGYVRGGSRGGRGGFSHGGQQESHHSSAPAMIQMPPGTPPQMQYHVKPGYPQSQDAFQQQMIDPKSGAQAQATGYANFKTVKCKFFDQGKNCPYKDRCSFAHGDTELRQQALAQQQAPMQHQAPPMMPAPPMPMGGHPGYMPQGPYGGYPMPVDIMQQQQMAAAGMGHPGMWGNPQYPQMMMPGGGVPGVQQEFMSMPPGSEMMMQNVHQQMMGMGHPGMPQQMQNPAGMMMPGMMQPAHNPLDMPFRFQFPQQMQDPNDGKIIYTVALMDLYFIDRSQTTIDEVQRAQQLNAEGNTKDCLSILMALYEKSKVLIQEVQGQQPVQ